MHLKPASVMEVLKCAGSGKRRGRRAGDVVLVVVTAKEIEVRNCFKFISNSRIKVTHDWLNFCI